MPLCDMQKAMTTSKKMGYLRRKIIWEQKLKNKNLDSYIQT